MNTIYEISTKMKSYNSKAHGKNKLIKAVKRRFFIQNSRSIADTLVTKVKEGWENLNKIVTTYLPAIHLLVSTTNFFFYHTKELHFHTQ